MLCRAAILKLSNFLYVPTAIGHPKWSSATPFHSPIPDRPAGQAVRLTVWLFPPFIRHCSSLAMHKRASMQQSRGSSNRSVVCHNFLVSRCCFFTTKNFTYQIRPPKCRTEPFLHRRLSRILRAKGIHKLHRRQPSLPRWPSPGHKIQETVRSCCWCT